jgi:hypothetical protein
MKPFWKNTTQKMENILLKQISAGASSQISVELKVVRYLTNLL